VDASVTKALDLHNTLSRETVVPNAATTSQQMPQRWASSMCGIKHLRLEFSMERWVHVTSRSNSFNMRFEWESPEPARLACNMIIEGVHRWSARAASKTAAQGQVTQDQGNSHQMAGSLNMASRF
jgi:hypothetical protein